jgi:hypothetical protein
VPEALRIAKIALDLDPTDLAAKRLVEDLEGDLAKLVPEAPPVIPLTTKPAGQGGAPAPSASSAKASACVLDISPDKPRVGQQVTFVARISPGKAKVEAATFTVSGATLASATMPAVGGQGGVFRGGFAFLEAGTFDVTFTATVDGAPARAERRVVSQAAGAAPHGASHRAPPRHLPRRPPRRPPVRDGCRLQVFTGGHRALGRAPRLRRGTP